MKEILIGIGFAVIVLVSMSYSTTNSKGIMNATTLIPLKQSGVLVTTDNEKMNKLIKKGWIVEDVDISARSGYDNIKIYYTLVKY